MPPFVISTGDYQFSSTKSGQAAPQMDLYQQARAQYPGVQFPAMGNHECTGATASNCGSSGSGMTEEYTAFLQKFLAPIQKTLPYYVVHVNASDGSWTSKFVVIAANAWDSVQADMARVRDGREDDVHVRRRHEPAAATTAPGYQPVGDHHRKVPLYARNRWAHAHVRKDRRKADHGRQWWRAAHRRCHIRLRDHCPAPRRRGDRRYVRLSIESAGYFVPLRGKADGTVVP